MTSDEDHAEDIDVEDEYEEANDDHPLLPPQITTSFLVYADMKFVQNFTPPDFQVKNFTPSISPNFNSFSKKKHKKLVKMEKFTPLATNFTLPPGLTGWTNSTSVNMNPKKLIPHAL